MSDVEIDPPKKSPVMGMVVGLALAILGGAGGFAALPFILPSDATTPDAPEKSLVLHAEADIAFVRTPDLVITILGQSSVRRLRFVANLEVPQSSEEDVTKMMPRVVDALTSFLQAVDPSDLTGADSLFRLRAQMLHRVRLVVGAEHVRDMLIAEFVLN